MAGKQQFERLVALEEEAIDDEQETHNHHHKDSCRVPMINDENLVDWKSGSKLKAGQIKPGSSKAGSFQFTLNGRHFQMNSDHLKYMSLVTLTVQNAALNLTMRASRTQKEQFSTSVAVTMAEILKLVTCMVILFFEECHLGKTVQSIKTSVIYNYMDTLKVAVPSFVYYVQNNLLYIGSTHLDAATCQVAYQLKIITTAVFSVTMLNKKLSKLQWLSLIILFAGVALIQTLAVSKQSDEAKHDQQPLMGFMAILVACCLSGFAGVYFEKILKNTGHVSLWIRNIQLAMVTIPIGLFQVLLLDTHPNGMFQGFTSLTWFCILLQAQGGLLVAVVVKFANNILKGFATSMAIVISMIASMFLFDFELTLTFLLGASLVIGSVMLYNRQ